MPHPRPGRFEPSELWEKVREPLFWLDSELRIAWVNHAWETLTGYSSASVVGITCHAHAPSRGDDPADLASSFHPPPESLTGLPAGTTTLVIHPSGERIWRRLEFWPFHDEHDVRIGLLGVVRGEGLEHSVPDTTAGSLHVQLLEIRRQLHKHVGFDSLLGSGPAHRRLLEQVRLAAGSTLPVLLLGEQGTGKRFVARTIHHNTPHRSGPLIPFDPQERSPPRYSNASFLPRAPRQAHAHKTRRLTQSPPGQDWRFAEGSTVLLRQIFELPRDLQSQLIASLDSSVRLIGTTILDPDIALSSGQIRPDFYFALDRARHSLAPAPRAPR